MDGAFDMPTVVCVCTAMALKAPNPNHNALKEGLHFPDNVRGRRLLCPVKGARSGVRCFQCRMMFVLRTQMAIIFNGFKSRPGGRTADNASDCDISSRSHGCTCF